MLAIIQNTRNEKIRVMYAAYTIEKNLADAAIVHDILKALGGKYNEMNTTLNPLFDKTEYNEYLIDSFDDVNTTVVKFCLYDVKRTNIRISESIDGIPVTVIKSEAFHNEENIITVALPSSITDIQQGAFATCRKLTSINLPDGLTEISDNAFILCQSLQAISIPNTVKRIGSGAFDGTALSTISLENVEIIEDNAFASCKLSSVYLSSELKEICDRAFNNNRHLQKITIPEGVTFIGRECFQYCENLKSITLPESLTSIGIRCFDGCKTLKEIKIPPNVESLSGTQMFSGDVSLEVIYVPADCKIPNGEKPFDGCNARIVFY